MKITGLAALSLIPVLITACDSPVANELDPDILSLLSGPLAVGEVQSFAGGSAQRLSVASGAGGAEYLYVVSNVSFAGGQSVAITVEGDGVSPGPATAKLPAEGSRLDRAAAEHVHGRGLWDLDDGGFHIWHRQREERLVRDMVGGLPAGGLSLLLQAAPTTAAVPRVGDIIQLNVNAFQACENPVWQDARVEAVSAQAIVVSDTRNPAGLAREDFERIATEFDQKAYPLAQRNFGDPARQIGPPRTTIFYTVAVNELQLPGGAAGLIGGFFFARDLFPRAALGRLPGCPASNQQEMFYMRTADPEGQFGLPTSLGSIQTRTLATVMHEFQHLINASRRLYVVGADEFEEVWLNEALSHIAEEVLFYQESGLSAGQNISLDDLRVSQQRLDAVNRFQVQNLVRYLLYLSDAPAHTPISPTDGLEVRGAAWSFLRYLADQHVADDAAFFFSLVNSQRRGIQNLRHNLGMDLQEPMRRWDVSNFADGLVPNLEPIYRQPSWNFRSVLPALTQDDVFPLTAERLGPTGSVSVAVRGGSAAFIRFGVPAGQRAMLTTLAGGGTPPETIRGTLVRIR
ncbi:MAG: hypothetical protein H0X65_08725 [Gemmatimonadetes bacterium]|nr:hypothetical protein [Gemmatimonadota bacterium]